MTDRVGLTWPTSLPLAVYAQVLQAAPDTLVPLVTATSEKGALLADGVTPSPGMVLLVRRTWWEESKTRRDQARGRLEDGMSGGWNCSSSTHPSCRSIPGDPNGRRLLIDYLSRRKPPTTASPPTGSPALKRHEIFLVDRSYDVSVPPDQRDPLPSTCLIHWVQDDIPPDSRVMLPHPPIIMIDPKAPASQVIDASRKDASTLTDPPLATTSVHLAAAPVEPAALRRSQPILDAPNLAVTIPHVLRQPDEFSPGAAPADEPPAKRRFPPSDASSAASPSSRSATSVSPTASAGGNEADLEEWLRYVN